MSNVIQRKFSDNYVRPRWNSLIDDLFADLFDRTPRTTSFYPEVDFCETDKEYRLDVEVPGVDKNSIDISLKDNILTVAGERTVETSEALYSRYERKSGRFSRSFHLPQSADPSKVTASSKDGILQILIPKVEEQKPLRIPVT